MTVELPTLAVTGVTGTLGRLVAGELAAAGTPQRLLARTVSRAPELTGAIVLPFAYEDQGSCAIALARVQTLLMVSASESADRVDRHRAFIDSAVAAGVTHVVYTSFVGAAPDATFTLARDHFATEQYLKSSGLAYTFLRNNMYLDFLAALVGEDGVIRGPAGTGRVAAVARADIARAAAVVLTDPAEHANGTYELTGPQALTLSEIATVLSEARGTAVTFHDETMAEAYDSRARWGAPDWQNDAWVTTYTAIAAGDLARISDDVMAITGRAPLSLAQLVAAAAT
jgi:NAD(P)H dehydrogenase (quinone)